MTGFPTFTFAGSESYTVTYEEDSGKSYSADDVYFNQEGEPLDTSLVDDYLANLSGVELTDYVTLQRHRCRAGGIRPD